EEPSPKKENKKLKKNNRKPKENNRKPKENNRKPKENNRKPKEYNRKPKEYNRKPKENNRKPKENNRKPKENNRKPKENNRKPKENNRKPKENNRKPKENNRKPKENNRKPKEYNRKPKENNRKPKENNRKLNEKKGRRLNIRKKGPKNDQGETSLLTYWTSPTMAEVTLEAVPPHVVEGNNVLLLLHNTPPGALNFFWFRANPDGSNRELGRRAMHSSRMQTGPAYTGRETIYPNGSLLLQNVTQEDARTYKILVTGGQSKTATVQFHVHTLLTNPKITSKISHTWEGSPVALMCEPKTQNTTHLWRRNGQSLSEEDRLKLSEGNRVLILLSVVRTDTGPYECARRNPVSASPSDPFTLNITYGQDVPITSPSNIHFHSRTNLRLSCQTLTHLHSILGLSMNEELQPYLEPKHAILQRATSYCGPWELAEISEDEGLSDGPLHCLSTEPVTPPSIHVNKTTVKGQTSVSLTCLTNDTGISIHWLFNGQSLEITDRIKLLQNTRTLLIDHVRSNDSGEYQCEVSNPASSKRSDPILLDI
ncbi:hypothetical protein A6R68_01793, partial [Neotoma lepida]